MKERGILFSAPMVLALLAGTKTQTRRALNFQRLSGSHDVAQVISTPDSLAAFVRTCCPYGVPGDRLAVREAWRTGVVFDHEPPRNIPDCAPVRYEATEDALQPGQGQWGRYRHARFMPRWASRILLEVTEVRVERLQDISEEDAIAEGVTRVHRQWDTSVWTHAPGSGLHEPTARDAYRRLWESINGPGSWAANPWVWAVSFKRVTS